MLVNMAPGSSRDREAVQVNKGFSSLLCIYSGGCVFTTAGKPVHLCPEGRQQPVYPELLKAWLLVHGRHNDIAVLCA